MPLQNEPPWEFQVGDTFEVQFFIGHEWHPRTVMRIIGDRIHCLTENHRPGEDSAARYRQLGRNFRRAGALEVAEGVFAHPPDDAEEELRPQSLQFPADADDGAEGGPMWQFQIRKTTIRRLVFRAHGANLDEARARCKVYIDNQSNRWNKLEIVDFFQVLGEQ
jgi:hypothetical protein